MSATIKDLFICHNRADKDWARALGERVEQEDWAGRKLSVFFDEWDIEAGDNILLKINNGLAASRFVAVVLSPEMLRSDWCGLEWTSTLAQDPMNRQGRLVPLLRRDRDAGSGERIDIPPILRPFNFLDFRDEKEFARTLARLLAKVRGEAPPRGRGQAARAAVPSRGVPPPVLATYADARAEPDTLHETLISNLLPVHDLPRVIWSAPTTLASKADLPKGNALPPFILREGCIYTFADLSAEGCPFRQWLPPDGGWKRHPVLDWRGDPDRWRWVVELLNISLTGHLRKQSIVFDRDAKRYFFRPRKPGKSVRLRWGSGTTRTVVRAPGVAGGNWVHQGARLSFETLGDRLFLAVEPCWVFTTDGLTSVRKQDVGPLAMQWAGKERNGTIVRHVLAWADVLTNGRRTGHVDTGDKPVVIGRLPATVGMGVGLADDQAAIRALLKFTRAEQELEVPEEVVFEYLEGEGDDDEVEHAA